MGVTVEIEKSDDIAFILPRHYSGRKPQVTYSFGYYEDDSLVASLTIGKPASRALCIGICGHQFSSSVYELNRLCAIDGLNTPLSHFVSTALKMLKVHNLIIVSYADTQMGHHGYIYQASNFIYTGLTKGRTDKYVEGNRHPRHYSNEMQGSLRRVRSPKHRYVYFASDRRHKKMYLKHLKYPILPYPKGDNEKYVLGEYIEPIIIDTSNTGSLGS